MLLVHTSYFSKGGFYGILSLWGGSNKIKVNDIEDIIFNVLGNNRSHTATNSPSSKQPSIDATTGMLTSPNGSMKSEWGKITFLKDGHYIYFNTNTGVIEKDFKKGESLLVGTSVNGFTTTFAMKIKC